MKRSCVLARMLSSFHYFQFKFIVSLQSFVYCTDFISCLRYGAKSKRLHDMLGRFLVPPLHASNPGTSSANGDGPKERHLAKFDGKKFRSRCKMKGCKSFTNLYCVKCSTESKLFHLCITKKRNCFFEHHS